VLRTGRAIRGAELIIERPDGTRRHVLPCPNRLRIGQDLLGTVNMLLDITDLKFAERAAREARVGSAMATRTGRIGLWDWDIMADRVAWTDSSTPSTESRRRTSFAYRGIQGARP
jgi:PAS domain-containing protein